MTPPLLRWAGSKRKLLPAIRAHVPEHVHTYIEPFAGSACLLFAIGPSRSILGDVNTELIETYKQVRRDHASVADVLSGLRRSKRRYLEWRSIDPATLSPARRAARFIYLNRYCFNGLYRTNSRGEFNVPFGAANTGRLPSRETLRACADLLLHTKLLTGDFAEVAALARPMDFVYMDPPFAVDGKRIFREYSSAAFTSGDVERLRVTMLQLDRRGVRFVVSYAECEESKTLAQNFRVEKVCVRRNIAGFAHQRAKTNEVLIFN